MTALRTLFTVREIAGLVDGELFFPEHGVVEGSDRDASIASVTIDSRTAGPGSMFVPLPGRFADGHDFIDNAVNRGATLVLMSTEYYRKSGERIGELERRHPFIYFAVDDVLECLQNLARYYLGKFPGLTRIGVTGSNGKTTTKEMIGTILSLHSPTCMSHGNLNSEIGLPLSLFEVRPEHRYGVFEMAMNHRGEIDLLADVLRPNMGLITNIGRAHIGQLGSQERIAEEKKKLFSRFSGNEQAFLPEHDAFLEYLSRGVNGRIHLYGRYSTPGIEGVTDRDIAGSVLHWQGHDIELSLPGEHNVLNALGAISVALELGVRPDLIKEGLERVAPQFGRSEVIRGDITIVQDCYNANPESMIQSISSIDRWDYGTRKVLVLGAMMELGDLSDELHREVGRAAGRSHADALFLVGEQMGAAEEAARGAGFSGQIVLKATAADIEPLLAGYLAPGDLVLLKGSRSLSLERLTPMIQKLQG